MKTMSLANEDVKAVNIEEPLTVFIHIYLRLLLKTVVSLRVLTINSSKDLMRITFKDNLTFLPIQKCFLG